jgi:hypothetical protein
MTNPRLLEQLASLHQAIAQEKARQIRSAVHPAMPEVVNGVVLVNHILSFEMLGVYADPVKDFWGQIRTWVEGPSLRPTGLMIELSIDIYNAPWLRPFLATGRIEARFTADLLGGGSTASFTMMLGHINQYPDSYKMDMIGHHASELVDYAIKRSKDKKHG